MFWENKAFDFAYNVPVIGTYKMHKKQYVYKTIMVVQPLIHNMSDI